MHKAGGFAAGIFISPIMGDRGQITARGVHSGDGWVLVVKRVGHGVGKRCAVH
jgi:hypothetical protein